MNESDHIRILLVEDDEEDMILTRDLLRDIKGRRIDIEWEQTFDGGLKTLCRNLHDICFVDYRLGAHDGIELVKTAKEGGAETPIILLTGMGQEEVDVAAMNAGAADYIVKGSVTPEQLERTIRYAIERKRAASRAAFDQARLAAFGAQVGLALTQRAPLPFVLESCANTAAQYLNGSLAQIWIHDAEGKCFTIAANGGPSFCATHGEAKLFPLDGPLRGEQAFVSSLEQEESFKTRTWAVQQGFVSFAAYPLTLENNIVGCMSLYSNEPMAATVLQELASVANGVGLYIQRKQTESALDASESRYLSVVSSIREVVFQMSEFGYWTFLNPAWTAITGFDVKDTTGKFFLDYFHPEDRDSARIFFLKLANGEIEQGHFESRILTRQGALRDVEMFLRLTRDQNRTVLGVAGSLNDITERKHAEMQVQKLAAFPRFNPNPVLEFSADGKPSYINDAAKELVLALGKDSVTDILPASHKDMVLESLAQGAKRLHEQVCIQARTISWSFFPVKNLRVVHCYGTDITDVLSLEQQFRHAQKLESVGQMAAGIAHDFNNIITVIQGYAECLQIKTKADESLAGPLKQIGAAARRASTLTRQLLLFSRKQVIQSRPLNLNVVVRDFSKMLPRVLGEDIVLEIDFPKSSTAIEADQGMMEQVVMNLAVNARDAMPRGGCLRLVTRTVEIGPDYVRQKPEARVGRFVSLAVQDTGSGMDDNTLARIYEPFFSTKEVGRGTGLGLATVYGIVKQHQGWLEVKSAVGVGTTFTVFLPALAKEIPETEDLSADSTVPARGGRETILLVEDEPVLRELVGKVLKDYQYNVIEACTGAEALNVWDRHEGKFDLLLTDMVMPEGVSGAELAQKLRERKPDLRIIYSSGYSGEVVGRNFTENDPFFLSKPYRPPQLAQRVRQCLDTPPQPVLEVVSRTDSLSCRIIHDDK